MIDDLLQAEPSLARRFDRHSAFSPHSTCAHVLTPSTWRWQVIRSGKRTVRYAAWTILMIGDQSLFWSARIPISMEDITNKKRYEKYITQHHSALEFSSLGTEKGYTSKRSTRHALHCIPISSLSIPSITRYLDPGSVKCYKRVAMEFPAFLASSPWGIVAGTTGDDPVSLYCHLRRSNADLQ